jgi:hypothetical protein
MIKGFTFMKMMAGAYIPTKRISGLKPMVASELYTLMVYLPSLGVWIETPYSLP